MKHTQLTVGRLARAKGYNITTFGRAAELAQGTARAYWYGYINQFDGDVLERIAKSLDVQVSNLFEPKEEQAAAS